MRMPRWVLFDCGEFPGIVFGFGQRLKNLYPEARQAYGLEEGDPESFVPLSMWVAIRCAEEGAWFGHNLSSANLILKQEPLPGLGTLTKALGILVTGVKKQYGATQWQSSSLRVHLRFGAMKLLSAYTPAHTHEETFSYLIPVKPGQIEASLAPEWRRVDEEGERTLLGDDSQAIRALHADLELGQLWSLINLRSEGSGQRLFLRRG